MDTNNRRWRAQAYRYIAGILAQRRSGWFGDVGSWHEGQGQRIGGRERSAGVPGFLGLLLGQACSATSWPVGVRIGPARARGATHLAKGGSGSREQRGAARFAREHGDVRKSFERELHAGRTGCLTRVTDDVGKVRRSVGQVALLRRHVAQPGPRAGGATGVRLVEIVPARQRLREPGLRNEQVPGAVGGPAQSFAW